MNAPATSTAPTAAPGRRLDVRFLLAVLVAVLLWGYGIHRRSFWIDEFHSLQHDRQPTLGAFFESVRSDNHPPLSFLLQRTSLGLLGESELSLRLPTLLVGVGLLAMTWFLCRRLADPTHRTFVVWIVALSSFCFDVFTEARMYGLLALSVLGLLESSLAALDGRRARWWAALWVCVGLHSHYYFIHSLIVSALLTCFLAWREPGLRRRALSALPPLFVGCLAFLPWAVWGFWEQLHHGLPPGGNYRGLNALAQSIGHLFYLNASAGGAFMTFGVALPGVLVAAAFGALGLRRFWSRRDDPRQRALLLFLLGLGLGVPLWSHGISLVFERASYGWRYIAGSLVPMSILIGAGMVGADRARRWSRTFFLATLTATTFVVAFSGGRENYRAAVTHILAEARPGDAVLTRPLWEADPEQSPTGWGFYAIRVPRAQDQFLPTEIRLNERREALSYERVWVFTRDLHHLYVLEELRRHFEHEQVWSKGRGMVLHLFWNGPGTQERIGQRMDSGPAGRQVDSSRNSH